MSKPTLADRIHEALVGTNTKHDALCVEVETLERSAASVTERAAGLLVGWEREIHFTDDGTPTKLGEVFIDVRDFLRDLSREAT